ncbi:creatininase family protein [Aminobacter sp. AP02]|uniref:creatininase family protein n=1 Tax=Aminobacter sp. AP02 TaxID=2135737 RepID=UPI000D6A84E8|nr:creatininase family protein [Aminobacter sp. AP02]PWK69130.1 creatinine amidohydrolase [Aminobacter sp. AP02]
MTKQKRRVWWGDFKAADFASMDLERTIAVIPVAAIEQHGPHLPVSTDLSIMEGMLAEVFARLPENLDARFLPIQAVGKSDEHIHAPGTLSLPANMLVDAWTELGASVARAGIRKFVFLTSHGGNEEVMGIVSRELRVRFAALSVRTSWGRFGYPESLYPGREIQLGIHGGDVETSLMLHFRPDLVDMAQAEDFASSFERAEKEFELLRSHGQHGFSWLASDLNPQGVVGNATVATAEKGRLTAAHQAEGFIRLLQDIRKAKLSEWLA